MIRELVLTATVILCLGSELPAQPTVAPGGILNVASYAYPALPGGSIAQGSMFVVFGDGTSWQSGISVAGDVQNTTGSYGRLGWKFGAQT